MEPETYSEYFQQLRPSHALEDGARYAINQSLACVAKASQAVRKECEVFRAEACRPDWRREPGNPYEPHTWKKYHIGDFDYDLVVYRRPRRSFLAKVFCCGQ